MTDNDRQRLIDQLDRSFAAMPYWVKCATKHAMAAPTINPRTGLPFASFKECIQEASDETLLILKEDFNDNGDLLE